MSPLLIALLGILILPLFVATWRMSLFGLSCQGILMAWIAYRTSPEPSIASDWLTLAEFICVRGLGAPIALYGVLRSQNAPRRNDVIPPNLLSWTVALGIVLVAFNFSDALVGGHGDQQTLVAVAAAGVMLGFLVLATRSDPFSQMIGALRIENAIALFELGGQRSHETLAVRLGQIGVLVIIVTLCRWYLKMLSDPAHTTVEAASTEPTL